MRLGQKIAALHKKNHLFQEALAEKMNVSRQAVSKWESEQSIPDIEKIVALSELFGNLTIQLTGCRKIMNKYATLYWLIAVLLYLGYSFITNDWERSWIIWPIAGILYGIIEKIISLCHNDIAAE